jgi:beta-glucosidase
MLKTISFIISLLVSAGMAAQQPRYLDTNLTFEERVDDLVSRMTLEEKISQLRYDAPAIERLGIPEYNWWNEGLHGVARSGLATVFPQAIGLAASWDRGLMFRVASAISDEARAKYNEHQRKGKRGIYQGLTFWSPNINIFRDPRWGRGMETYGEDPFLTGSMAVEFIRGMQGDHPRYLKTVATSKHFAVHSGPEPLRHGFDAVVDNIDLYGTYLPAFEMTVRQADVQSVMCAYNRFRGDPCCGSDPLLQQILREEWGFRGYVVSDCWAIMDFYNFHGVVKTQAEAAALALRSGTDLNCGVSYRSLGESLEHGLITEEEIDRSVKRLMLARFRLGMFDPPETIPFASIPIQEVDGQNNRDLALEAARGSIVLLKNEGGLLPLSKTTRKIAVIGPNADNAEVMLGNYNGTPAHPVTPLKGIRDKLPEAYVSYSPGCPHAEGLPIFETIPPDNLFRDARAILPGLSGQFFNGKDLAGKPLRERIDTCVDFNWWDEAPYPELDPDGFSVRWKGYLVPDKSGTYAIGAEGMNGFRLFFQDSLACQFNSVHETWKRYVIRELEAGKAYPVTLEFFNYHSYARVSLVWSYLDKDLRQEAFDAAAEADAVVVCLGLSPRLEGEEMDVKVDGFAGGDRTSLDLPEVQQKLLEELCKLHKPIVLVLLNGSALAVNWAHGHVPAIIEAWYPGQAGGTAIADVLFGGHNPSGKLPVTFYRSGDQLPPFEDYSMKNRTYRYFSGDPLYPFGYGLSFTTFEYRAIRIEEDNLQEGGHLKVSVKVRNTGKTEGEEVVQLYCKYPENSLRTPPADLKGFEKACIEPGGEKTVVFTLSREDLMVPDKDGKKLLLTGRYRLIAGGCSPGPRSEELGMTGVETRFIIPD